MSKWCDFNEMIPKMYLNLFAFRKFSTRMLILNHLIIVRKISLSDKKLSCFVSFNLEWVCQKKAVNDTLFAKETKNPADSADSKGNGTEINFKLSFNVVGYFLSNLNIYSMCALNKWPPNSNNQQTCEKWMDAKVDSFPLDCTSNLMCTVNEMLESNILITYRMIFSVYFFLSTCLNWCADVSIKGSHKLTNLVRKISRDQRSVCKFPHSVCLCLFVSFSLPLRLLLIGRFEAVGPVWHASFVITVSCTSTRNTWLNFFPLNFFSQIFRIEIRNSVW